MKPDKFELNRVMAARESTEMTLRYVSKYLPREGFEGFYPLERVQVDLSLPNRPIFELSRPYFYNPETRESYRYLGVDTEFLDLHSKEVDNAECARAWTCVMYFKEMWFKGDHQFKREFNACIEKYYYELAKPKPVEILEAKILKKTSPGLFGFLDKHRKTPLGEIPFGTKETFVD